MSEVIFVDGEIQTGQDSMDSEVKTVNSYPELIDELEASE